VVSEGENHDFKAKKFNLKRTDYTPLWKMAFEATLPKCIRVE